MKVSEEEVMSVSLATSVSYTELMDARETLANRKDLRSSVEEWWLFKGWGLPPLPPVTNMAVMARQIGTFRYEDAAFVMRAENAGLVPVWLEYSGDKMNSRSNYKRSLLEIFHCDGRGRSGGLRIRSKEKFASIQEWSGKPLNVIKGHDNRTLLDYHHEHQDRVYPEAIRRDVTQWLQQMGAARDYYEATVSIYVAHAVLFEDYHGGESGEVLGSFTTEIFEPAWHATFERFGAVPIVVKLPWGEGFRCYPMDDNWRNHGIVLPEHLK